MIFLVPDDRRLKSEIRGQKSRAVAIEQRIKVKRADAGEPKFENLKSEGGSRIKNEDEGCGIRRILSLTISS